MHSYYKGCLYSQPLLFELFIFSSNSFSGVVLASRQVERWLEMSSRQVERLLEMNSRQVEHWLEIRSRQVEC